MIAEPPHQCQAEPPYDRLTPLQALIDPPFHASKSRPGQPTPYYSPQGNNPNYGYAPPPGGNYGYAGPPAYGHTPQGYVSPGGMPMGYGPGAPVGPGIQAYVPQTGLHPSTVTPTVTPPTVTVSQPTITVTQPQKVDKVRRLGPPLLHHWRGGRAWGGVMVHSSCKRDPRRLRRRVVAGRGGGC
jgi:hypothetical protein